MNLGSPRPGLIGLALLLCALAFPASASAANINVSHGSLDFGQQEISTPPAVGQRLTVTVSNAAGTNLVVGLITISGSSAFVKVLDDCSGASLAAGQNCQFAIAFDPSVAGALTASFSIPSNGGSLPPFVMTGTGVAARVFSPNTPSHGFGTVDVFDGTPTNGFFRVTNAGSAAMTFETLANNGVKVTGADAAHFQIISQDCTGADDRSQCVLRRSGGVRPAKFRRQGGEPSLPAQRSWRYQRHHADRRRHRGEIRVFARGAQLRQQSVSAAADAEPHDHQPRQLTR